MQCVATPPRKQCITYPPAHELLQINYYRRFLHQHLCLIKRATVLIESKPNRISDYYARGLLVCSLNNAIAGNDKTLNDIANHCMLICLLILCSTINVDWLINFWHFEYFQCTVYWWNSALRGIWSSYYIIELLELCRQLKIIFYCAYCSCKKFLSKRIKFQASRTLSNILTLK